MKIPAGVDDGNRLRLPVEEDEPPGGEPGDLYVVIQIDEHQRFERLSDDLQALLDIDMIQATLGDSIVFDGIDGPVNVTVPPGTQPNKVIRVPGEGVPSLQTRSDAASSIAYHVNAPEAHPTQRDLLERFRDES